jgi:hypothetical protein
MICFYVAVQFLGGGLGAPYIHMYLNQCQLICNMYKTFVRKLNDCEVNGRSSIPRTVRYLYVDTLSIRSALVPSVVLYAAVTEGSVPRKERCECEVYVTLIAIYF